MVVISHVAVDAAQVGVVDAAADQTLRARHNRVLVHLHVAERPVNSAGALSSSRARKKGQCVLFKDDNSC
jgi:hypothetical protein